MTILNRQTGYLIDKLSWIIYITREQRGRHIYIERERGRGKEETQREEKVSREGVRRKVDQTFKDTPRNNNEDHRHMRGVSDVMIYHLSR